MRQQLALAHLPFATVTAERQEHLHSIVNSLAVVPEDRTALHDAVQSICSAETFWCKVYHISHKDFPYPLLVTQDTSPDDEEPSALYESFELISELEPLWNMLAHWAKEDSMHNPAPNGNATLRHVEAE